MARHEVRLAGFGGQGIILSGYILGKAAALYDGKDAVFSQSYGPEARGGACAAEVVIDDDAVDYPVLTRPDILVLMSQEAAIKYSADMADDAVVLIDDDLVTAGAGRMVYGAPTTRIAEEMGRRLVANIAMLGFLTGATSVVGRAAMEEAIRTTVPPKTIDLNLRAFGAGFDHGQRAVS
ncbi:MAG: pyruvate ferredoxin oxidoreductase [Anaerolinea sp.]|nr:pyruvate ferredoxin oxidoreductase [Anaerolinea sp.]